MAQAASIGIVQGIVAQHEAGQRINPTFLADKIESLKNREKTVNYLISTYGQKLSAMTSGGADPQSSAFQEARQKYEQYLAEKEQIRSLKSKAISIRSSYGVSPPAEKPKPQPKTYQAQKMYADGKEIAGVTYDKYGRVTSIIPLKNQPHKYYSGGMITQAAGKKESKEKNYAPKNVLEAESFVDVINQESQILIAQESEEGWAITPNPNITLAQSQIDVIEKNLLSMGFERKGEGYFYKKEPKISAKEPFDLAVPFFPEERVSHGEPFDFTKPFYKDDAQETSASEIPIPILLEDRWRYDPSVSSPYPLTGSGLVATPIVKFYETSHTKPVEEAIAKFETETGLYLKDTPVGEVRFSQAVGFLGESIETGVKAGASIGTLIASGVKAGEFAVRESKGEIVPSSEKAQKASEFGASLTYLNLVPLLTATTLGSIWGSGSKVVAVDSATGKAVTTKTGGWKILSSEFTKEGVKYEGTLGSGFIPKGHPAYLDVAVQSVKSDVIKIAQPVITVGKLAGAGAKMGTATAVLQTGLDVATGQEIAIEKTKRAFLGGALFGITVQGYGMVKPKLTAVAQGIKGHVASTFSIKKVLDQSFDTGTEVATDVKILGMMGKSERTAIASITPESQVYAHAQVTQAGLNPFGSGTRQMQKIRVTTPQRSAPPIVVLPPSSAPALKVPVQRIAVKQSVKTMSLEEFSAPSLKLQAKLKEPEIGAFFEPSPKSKRKLLEIRIEALEADIESNASKTKLEKLLALREGLKSGQKAGQVFGQKFKIAQLQRARVGEIEVLPPILGQRVAQKITPLQKLRVRTGQLQKMREPTVLPPTVLSLDFALGDEGRKQQKKKKAETKTQYAPSVVGILTGKKEKKKKKYYTGLEIRGIASSKKSYGGLSGIL